MTEPKVQAVDAAPSVQKRLLQECTPKFSHETYLPLYIHVNGWSRDVRVETSEPVWYRSGNMLQIELPAGFVSDLASIPRVFWWFVSPWSLALPALFHDYLYSNQRVSRVVADAAFLSMMEARNVPRRIRWTVYLAVRMFGWRAWRA